MMSLWILAPFSFLCLWGAICGSLSRLGGWFALSRRFPASDKPVGMRFGMQSGGFGWVDYNGCLTIHVGQEGLGLSIWPLFRFTHPPLLLPWNELHVLEVRPGKWFGTVKMAVGEPPLVRIRLPLKVFEAAQEYLATK